MADKPEEKREYVVKTVQPDETTLNKDGFVGVDPIYQNFANDVDEPLEGDDDDDEPAAKAEAPKDDKPAAKPAAK